MIAVSAHAQSGNVIVSSNTAWASGSYALTSLTVNSGAVLTVGGGSTVSVTGAVLVTANSKVVLQSVNNAAKVGGVWTGAGVTVNAGSVQVDAGSSINADGQGYVAEAGPGSEAGTGQSAGGTYAGQGGRTDKNAVPYGSATAPVDLGSGGWVYTGTAGAGGGAIQLLVGTTLTLNGTISANGASAAGDAGAGSGGSVYVTTSTLSGLGTFQANGGPATGDPGAGGGGGGRVSVSSSAISAYTGITASTVSGGAAPSLVGTNGTLAFFDTSTSTPSVTIPQNFTIPSGTVAAYTNVTVTNGAVLTIGGGSTLNVSGTFIVTGKSTVVLLALNNTAQVAGVWVGTGAAINAATLQVDVGSSINADGQGYATQSGPGAQAGTGQSAGGTYGGIGGRTDKNAAPYGSATGPLDLGSGGWVYIGTPGAGGGAIRLAVANTLTLNGTISANGIAASGDAGAGSGGSLYVTTATLAGSGTFQANGGAASGDPGAGGGGGGRVAVYSNAAASYTGAATSTASGGTAPSYIGGNGTIAFFDTSAPTQSVSVYQNYTVPPNATTHFNNVTLAAGGTMTLGGGAQLIVDQALHVTGIITALSANNTTPGAGKGISIFAGSVQIDAAGGINADGQGYLAEIGPGAVAGPGITAGGSYGGGGGRSAPDQSTSTAYEYGSATAPLDLGSGGWQYAGIAAPGGGAIRLFVAGTLTFNGSLSANGGNPTSSAGGGSGGSVYIAANTINGTGKITANGGTLPTGGGSGGGGGRVSVVYANPGSFSKSLISVSGGTSDYNGTAGTVNFVQQATSTFIQPTGSVLHGTATLQWFSDAGVSVNLIASGPEMETVGAGLGVNSTFSWDTTTVPDGRYELRLVFYDASGKDIQEVPRNVVINNSIAWHSGTIAANQEWTASQVQGLDGTVIIPSGVTVTIDPGTVVKALPGAQIVVQPGGILNALGGTSTPVIFTAFDDSSVGGDSAFVGSGGAATPGEWNGISPQGGVFNSNSNTRILYVLATETGTLPASEAWSGDQLFLVTGVVTVPAGTTLTIQPGAVVKFGSNAGITVQPGGQLLAVGTVAQPIYFTSLNDNTIGAVAAGSTGIPMPGDWASIAINGGTANFNDVQMLYGGGPSGSSALIGMIETDNHAVVTISNSIIGQAFWNGILTGYINGTNTGGDTVTLTNSVVHAVEDRGINAWPGSTVNVVNDTFDGNSAGIMSHGGVITVANTIVSNTVGTTWGGMYICCGGTINSSYSDVWTAVPGVSNYGGGLADQTGINGNISANPVYVNNAGGNYRLNYGSPAIDSANGKAANYPLTDNMGAPRYNDPLVPVRTGVADTAGNYPDMGAFEFVQNATSSIDLRVSSVTGPAAAVSGSQVQLTWTDTNTGSAAAQGPWHDAVYLVQDPDTNPVLVLAGEVLVAGGITLGPGESYAATGTVTVPGSTVGTHRWEVVANDRGEVFVGQNSAHAKGISLDSVAVDLAQVIVDGPPATSSFAAPAQSAWYKLLPGANKIVSLNLSLSGSGGTPSPGVVQLLVGEGYVPTPQHYDIRQVEWNSPTASLVIPNTSNQTYYITAYAQSLISSPTAFSLSASTVAFSLTSVQPASIFNFASQIVTFVGGGFTPGDTYQLVGGDGTVYTASSVFVTDSTHAQVTFTMQGVVGGLYTAGGVPNGSYTAKVIAGGSTASLSNSLTVTTLPLSEAGGFFGTYRVNVQAPEQFRAGFPAEVTLNYQNITGYDQPAPVISFTASGANLAEMPPDCPGCNPQFPAMYQGVATSGLILGINQQGPAGVLPAGAQGSVKFLATPTGAGSVTFSTQAIDPFVPDPLIALQAQANFTCTASPCSRVVVNTGLFTDAAAMCSAYQPPGYNAPGFSRTCMQFLANAGYADNSAPCLAPGRGQQNCTDLDGSAVDNLLAANATTLSSNGIYESDATRLMAFELQNDGLNLFNKRYHQGAFGFGTSHPFDIIATIAAPSGVVIDYPDGRTRYFSTVNPNNANQLLGIPGDYGVLTVNSDSTWTITESDGTIYHFKNGSALQVLDYIQDLNGNRITLTYTNGLVSSAADSEGNTISYVYDSLGHITQSTDPVGRVTTYSYDIKSDTIHSTFLTSVTDSAGTTSFAWNEGGPSGVGYLAPGCVTTYCEPAIGVNTITYPDGTHKYFTYDSLGRMSTQSRDGGTEKSTFTYGPAGAMTVSDAFGNASQFIPNQYGATQQLIDPLGSATQLAYNAEQRVTQVLGPLGTNSSIGYDTQGNVALLLDPLGNQENLASSSNSRIQSFTDANGDATGFVYDSKSNLTGIVAPDGSASSQSTLDGFGHVKSFINGRGRTTNFAYDSRNLLTTKTYQDGSSVAYTYDTHHNLLTMVDSNGTTSLTYDPADRLTGIFYPTSRSIQYSYNTLGQRSTMSDSTGFTVKYSYDSAGRLSQLSDGSSVLIASYTYDAAGRLTKKTRGNGTYTVYTYDANQHPLHLINYGAGGSVLSEYDYTYDALGRQATMAGPSGAWSYSYDADNEITTVTMPGSTVNYSYDANGNRLFAAGIGYSVNNLDQYTAAGGSGYRYDADGNLISGGGWTYTYDDDSHLTSMVSATDTWTYKYDGFGARISATHNGVTTQYLNDPSTSGSVEAEFTGTGALISHFTYGLDLTSSVPAGGAASYYHFDASGNTVQMTSATGSVVNSYSYLPFGEKASSIVGVANPFTYVGESGVMDEGSGLYYMRNRWYSPALGRFIQRDPLGLYAGSNLYAYTDNNPTNETDPLGLEPPIGTDGNTNATIDSHQDANSILHESFGFQSPLQRNEQIERTTQGAKAQALKTALKLALPELPELEPLENPVGNYLINKGLNYPVEEGVQYGAEKLLDADKPEGDENIPEHGQPGKPGPSTEPGPAPVAPGKSYIIPCLEDMANFFSGGRLFNKQPQNTTTAPVGRSIDPNGKLTSGFGNLGYIPANTPILYTVYFENQPTASVPAVQVTVSDALPANLDWSTVQLNQIQFNNVTVNVPGALQSYTTQVNVATDANPVNVNAALNTKTGVITWAMQSVDPVTGALPANPAVGFLPPNNSANLGTGFVTFTVRPKAGLANGTTIANQASIVFDVNAAINTNTVTNTIDAVYPTSSISTLPATTASTSFPVSWSGTDPGGSGIATYDVYVSLNGGPYTQWLETTPLTSAIYPGAAGQSYSFYSMATDNVGLRQQVTGPVQTIAVSSGSAKTTPTVTVSPASSSITTTQAVSVTVAVSGGGTNPVATGSITLAGGGYTSAGSTLVSGSATIVIPAGSLALGADTLTATYTGDTNYLGASGTAAITVAATAPVIAFTVPNHTFGDAPFAVTATSTSPGAITYSITSGPATVSGSTVTLTGAGTVTVQASQAATGTYMAGTQSATFTVAAGAQTITFAGPASPLTYGVAPISLSASSSSGLAVTFKVLSGPATLTGSTLTINGAGTVVVAADQAGNTSFAAAAEITRSITVNRALPAAGITASPNPVLAQTSVTLTATITSASGTPTGTVVFSDGATTLGTSTLAAGIATLSVSALAPGTHPIIATYGGDANFNSASSTVISELVQDFTLTVGGSGATQTVAPGGTATFTLPLSPTGGTTFPAAVTFAATGLPTGFMATFSPASLAAGSSATNVVLTIQVPLTAAAENPNPGRGLPMAVLAILILPFVGGARRSRRWMQRLAVLAILLAGAGGAAVLTGCGGGSGSAGSAQPRTYNTIVTATSGTVSHTASLTITVQ